MAQGAIPEGRLWLQLRDESGPSYGDELWWPESTSAREFAVAYMTSECSIYHERMGSSRGWNDVG